MLPVALKAINPSTIDSCVTACMAIYEKLGATETIAKGPEMRDELLRQSAERFAEELEKVP